MFKRKYEFTCDCCKEPLLLDVDDRMDIDSQALNNGYIKILLTKKSEGVYKSYEYWICSKCKRKIYDILR